MQGSIAHTCTHLQTLSCRPIASLDHFLPEHLGNAALVEEVPMGTSKVVKVWASDASPSCKYLL